MTSIPLIEEAFCPDIFVSGIGKIEKLDGGLIRVILFSERRSDGGQSERVITAKIITPWTALPQALRMLMLAMGDASLLVVTDGGELIARAMN